MEKVTIKVLNNVKEDAKRNYQLFEWRLVEEKSDLKETTLTFERDETMDHYQDIIKLENRFNRVYSIPSWVSYIIIAIILVYVTLIAIFWKTKVLDLDKSGIVILMAVPTGILLLVNTGLSFYRNKQMHDHINKKEEKYRLYGEKIKALRDK